MKKELLMIGIMVGMMLGLISGVFAITDHWQWIDDNWPPLVNYGGPGSCEGCYDNTGKYPEYVCRTPSSCEDRGPYPPYGNWQRIETTGSNYNLCKWSEFCNDFIGYVVCNYGTNEAIGCENGCLWNANTSLFACSECKGPGDVDAPPTCDDGDGGLRCPACPTEPTEKLYTECEYRFDSDIPRDSELDTCGNCYGVFQDRDNEIPWEDYQCDNNNDGVTDDCFQCCDPLKMLFEFNPDGDSGDPGITANFTQIAAKEATVEQHPSGGTGPFMKAYYNQDSKLGGLLQKLDFTPFFNDDDPAVQTFLDDISDSIDWSGDECQWIKDLYDAFQEKIPGQANAVCKDMASLIEEGKGNCRQQSGLLTYTLDYVLGIESEVVVGAVGGGLTTNHAWVRVTLDNGNQFDLEPMGYKTYAPLTIRDEDGGEGIDLENCFICDQINECYTNDTNTDGVMDACA